MCESSASFLTALGSVTGDGASTAALPAALRSPKLQRLGSSSTLLPPLHSSRTAASACSYGAQRTAHARSSSHASGGSFSSSTKSVPPSASTSMYACSNGQHGTSLPRRLSSHATSSSATAR
eukprot:CAMPEP_0119093908 /NCGR_PEP_ID=MMETSP1178-20130426/164546_1 /TAXON_ID=33656 /ORGANISM="unid sp, Strain CCMP2000" /LENGTH=121 /DNA_ID=CAMNT_0007077605 /DNA_START=30 /DNA_END=395 /DNA_ORIENTATION=-